MKIRLIELPLIIKQKQNILKAISQMNERDQKISINNTCMHIDEEISTWLKGGSNFKCERIQNIHLFLLENNVECVDSPFYYKRFGLPVTTWMDIDKAIVNTRKSEKVARINKYTLKAKNLLNQSYRSIHKIMALKASMREHYITIHDLHLSEELQMEVQFVLDHIKDLKFVKELSQN